MCGSYKKRESVRSMIFGPLFFSVIFFQSNQTKYASDRIHRRRCSISGASGRLLRYLGLYLLPGSARATGHCGAYWSARAQRECGQLIIILQPCYAKTIRLIVVISLRYTRTRAKRAWTIPQTTQRTARISEAFCFFYFLYNFFNNGKTKLK